MLGARKGAATGTRAHSARYPECLSLYKTMHQSYGASGIWQAIDRLHEEGLRCSVLLGHDNQTLGGLSLADLAVLDCANRKYVAKARGCSAASTSHRTGVEVSTVCRGSHTAFERHHGRHGPRALPARGPWISPRS